VSPVSAHSRRARAFQDSELLCITPTDSMLPGTRVADSGALKSPVSRRIFSRRASPGASASLSIPGTIGEEAEPGPPQRRPSPAPAGRASPPPLLALPAGWHNVAMCQQQHHEGAELPSERLAQLSDRGYDASAEQTGVLVGRKSTSPDAVWLAGVRYSLCATHFGTVLPHRLQSARVPG
jgi:hypothetical protein